MINSVAEFAHTATYSPEDDKIRIYLSYRLPADEYKEIADLGFRNAPKQGCQFAVWSPEREDLALKLAGSIDPEGMSLAERAELKAERLEQLASKNMNRANAFHRAAKDISRRFEFGQPILVGHHSEGRARKDRERMDRAMAESCRCADAVNYWNDRAMSVERHASMKNSDETRANRIKALLAEVRKFQRDINESYIALKRWETISSIVDSGKRAELVKYYAGISSASPYINERSAWDLINSEKITTDEVLEISIEHHKKRVNSANKFRWIEHLLNRLAYERAEQGDVLVYTGELTPVILQAFLREFGADSPKCEKTEVGYKAVSSVPFPLHIESELTTELELSEGAWREKMQSCGYSVPEKKPRRASTTEKASIPLINPSKAEAVRLQAIWNKNMQKAVEGREGIKAKENTVTELTQQIYSNNSKGDYSPYETIEIDASGKKITQQWRAYERVKSGEPVCRIRVSSKNSEFYKPDSIIVVTDKPRKPLPIDWSLTNG